MKVMIDWYCTLLGARVAFADEQAAFLAYDEEHHRIGLLHDVKELLPRPEGWAVGFYHAAFTYKDLGTLLANYERLKAVGVLPWRPIIHGPTVSLYYRDPDGNDIETQVDVFPTAEAAIEWMQGDAFKANPIGVFFDPDVMVERFKAGVPMSELLRRPDSPAETYFGAGTAATADRSLDGPASRNSDISGGGARP